MTLLKFVSRRIPMAVLLLGSLAPAPACGPPMGASVTDSGGGSDTGSWPPPGPGAHHPAWWNRLSTSPVVDVALPLDAIRVELAVGHGPGLDDVGAWVDADGVWPLQHTALFGVLEGDRLYPTVRLTFADGSVEQVSSDGWTVDVTPPPVPDGIDDRRFHVERAIGWSGATTDEGAGFSHFEVRVGTGPGAGDVLDWSGLESSEQAVLDVETMDGRWHWVSVRAVDRAGNASLPVISDGFIDCPAHHAFVPADTDRGVAGFCVSRFEMRIQGVQDGDRGYDPQDTAEARPEGTPWAGVSKEAARLECDQLGDGHQLISNRQWQTIAHDLTSVASNWSGGAVGVGFVPRGHTDGMPAVAVPAGSGDPCEGTGNPSCTDPGHPDFSQRRTHHLSSGDLVWDFAGNLWEQVDGSAAGPESYWVGFDDAVFADGDGPNPHREAFAPRESWTEDHGMGRMYGGDGNLVRGGSFQPSAAGSAGAMGVVDAGVHAAHHKAWNTTSIHGFRCVYTPM